jgi:hypothetical protein
MRRILFIIFAIGAFLGTIILLFSSREKPYRRSSSSRSNFHGNIEEGLEKDKQMLWGDWQNIVGDFNNAFNKIA